jgi:hypothetical protein
MSRFGFSGSMLLSQTLSAYRLIRYARIDLLV